MDYELSLINYGEVNNMKFRGYDRKTDHPMYSTWSNMVYRCKAKPTSPTHYYYRDVSVCERWKSFENFLDDISSTIGIRPSNIYSLDRINNTGDYEPGNVRWATRRDQQLNRRKRESRMFLTDNNG